MNDVKLNIYILDLLMMLTGSFQYAFIKGYFLNMIYFFIDEICAAKTWKAHKLSNLPIFGVNTAAGA